MDSSVKVNKKYQIIIPEEIRKTLSISEGDQLFMKVENNKLIISLLPEDMAEYTLGLHK